MDNDNAKKINDSLNNLNKIMSLILVLAFDGSTFKSKTNDEIKKVMPRINETLKSIHENIYDWIIFYNWLLINCFNRCLSNES